MEIEPSAQSSSQSSSKDLSRRVKSNFLLLFFSSDTYNFSNIHKPSLLTTGK